MVQGYLGYQQGSESGWWWKVAQHLDEAKWALANALAHNLDDPSAVFVLQEKLREAQVSLLAIFEAKGLVPSSGQGAGVGATGQAPVPEDVAFSVPSFGQESLQDTGGESSQECVPGAAPESPQEDSSVPMKESELASAPPESEHGGLSDVLVPDVLVPEVVMPLVTFPGTARG